MVQAGVSSVEQKPAQSIPSVCQVPLVRAFPFKRVVYVDVQKTVHSKMTNASASMVQWKTLKRAFVDLRPHRTVQPSMMKAAAPKLELVLNPQTTPPRRLASKRAVALRTLAHRGPEVSKGEAILSQQPPMPRVRAVKPRSVNSRGAETCLAVQTKIQSLLTQGVPPATARTGRGHPGHVDKLFSGRREQRTVRDLWV